MTTDRSGDQRPAAERAFHKFMFEGRDLESREFEELCRVNPELDRELHSLRDQWRAVCSGGHRAGPTLRERIQRLFGSQADPEVSLSHQARSVSRESSGPGSSTLLRRLELHRGEQDRYELGDEIGRGGMGLILEVRDEDLRRQLAMKVMLGRGTESQSREMRQVRRFLEEAQITGQLDHPGIVPVHELGLSSDDKLFFTMRLIKGQTLKRIFDKLEREEGGWSLPRILGLLQKVCEAMAYAHSKGVVHRDLKPANVMVGRFGETYVMDWGLARVLGAEDLHAPSLKIGQDTGTEIVHTDREASPEPPIVTADGDVLGTPAYMPPEQAMGRIEQLGPRSDVYSVGAMLYQLLAGAAPYCTRGARISARTVLAMVIQGPPRPLAELAPDAPAELVALCEKAMARTPEDRYADMAEMAEDLRRYQENRPVRARPFSAGYALRLAFQRNRPAVLTAAALLLVLMLVTVGFIHKLQREVALSDRRLHVLNARAFLQEEHRLYPSTPAMIPLFDDWLERVDRLLSQRDRYEVAELAKSVTERERADVEELKANIALLAQRRELVARRRQIAGGLPARSSKDAAWARMRGEIEDDYGFEVKPQLGLVPLGRNEDSGLWEFWHVLSGERPKWMPQSVQLTEESGIVLVLLKGGSFTMGSPADEVGRQDYEEEQHLVTLLPFFISKYETTQAQWVRTMERNPSFRHAGSERQGQRFTLLGPVDAVTWFECEEEAARRLELVLPTEARWEYMCRGGSEEAYPYGETWLSLEGHENVSDASTGLGQANGAAPWNDSFPYPAPVGSFAPNGFGLHDVAGNVSEWCADRYAPYPEDCAEPGNGALPNSESENRMVRGGSYFYGPQYSRSALRQAARPIVGVQLRGVRFARELER